MESMSEITSSPATQLYREGWERAFGKAAPDDVLISHSPRSCSESAIPAKQSPESPTPATVDGSGLPALFPIQVKCKACGAAPYEDCFLITDDPSEKIYVNYIHDSRRKAAREERAN